MGRIAVAGRDRSVQSMTRRSRMPTVVLALVAAIVAVAVVAVVAVIDGGDSSSTGPAGAAGGAANDPSAIYEQAVSTALPSVVQIESPGKLGSGIVFDSSGDIVTNAHVVAGARTFTITTSDGKRHRATLRGAFPANDLAVVRVDGADLTPAHFADSSQLKVGERVLAIGNPLGLRSSVTDGIISAVSRTLSEGQGVALPSVVQTSAAINPGNSGGALIDLTGAVVGIPTLAATDPELGGSAAPGVGFAISSNTVTRIAGQLAKQGRVVDSGRAYLGVELGSLPQGGVMVASVVAHGPSAAAGVSAGDLIDAIGGHPTHTVDGVSLALANDKPGQAVRVELQRPDGSTATVTVKLGQLPGA
jgi:putative serine protease PepD